MSEGYKRAGRFGKEEDREEERAFQNTAMVTLRASTTSGTAE